MTVLEVIKLASDHLRKHNSESARLDAEVLLATALGLRRLDLYLQFDRELTETELSAYRALVARRAASMSLGESVAGIFVIPTGAQPIRAVDLARARIV